jgi:twitching motility protein PilJ
MDFSLRGFFGAGPAKGQALADTDLDGPTTQVKMSGAPKGYDPLGAVSIMEQLRTGTQEARQPARLPLIGHLPIVRQFQILGALLLSFIVLAVVMLLLSIGISSQVTTSATTATEMQMLSQRLARGTSLAVQGNVAVRDAGDSRDRFRADLDALTKGGNVMGVSLDVSNSEAVQAVLSNVTARWERVQKNATSVLDNQAALVTLSKALEGINQGNTLLLELAQQASAQIAQGGGSLREVDFTNQLAVLSQRIAKNANSLVSSDDIDPEIAFLLGKDTGTFRDDLNGLLKGSESLKLPQVRVEDARATLTDLQKRFTAYESGVNSILQNMQRLVVAKQAARGINQESEPLLADD